MDLESSINKLGFQILSQISKNSYNETLNIAISPLSLWISLSMAAIGAKSTTFNELSNILNFKSFAQVSPMITKKMELYKSESGEQLKVSILNAIATKEPLLKKFKSDAQHIFGAELFTDKLCTPEIINKWVSDSTNSQIKELVSPSTSFDSVILLNAVHFLGKWQFPFKKALTQKIPFYKTPTSIQICEMMQVTGEFNYFQNEKYQSIKLPYQTNTKNSLKLSAIVVLPTQNQNVLDSINEFQMDDFENIVNSLENNPNMVELQMPKLEIKYSRTYNKDLLAMGMITPFVGHGKDKADFTDMVEQTDAPIYISEVLQKCVVKVDEDGTEASAASAVIMQRSMPQVAGVEMIVNRPFLFYIVEEGPLILFSAAVNTME
jgi:serpin B